MALAGNVADVVGGQAQQAGRDIVPYMAMIHQQRQKAALDTLDRTFQMEGLKLRQKQIEGTERQRSHTRNMNILGHTQGEERLGIDREREDRLSEPSSVEEAYVQAYNRGEIDLSGLSDFKTSLKTQPKPTGKTSGQLSATTLSRVSGSNRALTKEKKAFDTSMRSANNWFKLSPMDLSSGKAIVKSKSVPDDDSEPIRFGHLPFESTPVDTANYLLRPEYEAARASGRATPQEWAEKVAAADPGLKDNLDKLMAGEGQSVAPTASNTEAQAKWREKYSGSTSEVQAEMLERVAGLYAGEQGITDWDKEEKDGGPSEALKEQFRQMIREGLGL